MKKTVLTFVAVAFGSCVAFAQTTPETEQQQDTNTEQTVTMDPMSDTSVVEAEEGRRPIAVEELPEAVQRSLQGEEFKAWTIVSAAELPANGTAQIERENVANTTLEGEGQADVAVETQDDAAATTDATVTTETEADVTTEEETAVATEEEATDAEEAAVVYEIELVSNEAEAGTEADLAQTEEAVVTEEGAEDAAVAQDQTAVAAKGTVVVVRFDEQGRMLSRTERSSDDTIENK